MVWKILSFTADRLAKKAWRKLAEMRWPGPESLIPAWLIQILLLLFGAGAVGVFVWWPTAILLGNAYLAAGMLGIGFAAVLAGAFYARVTGIKLPFLTVLLQAAVVKRLA